MYTPSGYTTVTMVGGVGSIVAQALMIPSSSSQMLPYIGKLLAHSIFLSHMVPPRMLNNCAMSLWSPYRFFIHPLPLLPLWTRTRFDEKAAPQVYWVWAQSKGDYDATAVVLRRLQAALRGLYMRKTALPVD